MSDIIKCTIEVDVDGTLQMKIPRTMTVESYQKMEIELAGGATRNVSLPANLADLEFFLLSASTYDGSITMGDGTDTLDIEGPVLLFGGEIGGHLSAPAFTNTLQFINGDATNSASLQIIVGLNVSAPPP